MPRMPDHCTDDPEQFIFHATDKKGKNKIHATLNKIAVPPEIAQILNEIITKGKFPYRTVGDIQRDALYHRIWWLINNWDGGYGDMLQRVRSIDAILLQEEARLDFERHIQQLGDIVNAVRDSPEHQKRIINSVAEEVYSMPDGYWKDRYVSQLKSSFGKFLEEWDASSVKPR